MEQASKTALEQSPAAGSGNQGHSANFQKLLDEIGAKKKVEERLRLCLDFMKKAISQEKTPSFKDFWIAKKMALSLFKESLPPRIRVPFWKEYTELSDEVKKLKELMDEESSFTEEQLGLAIAGIEEDIAQFDQKLAGHVEISLPQSIGSIEKNRSTYMEMQTQLALFNSLATRIVALRKELMGTEMRMRAKSRLFDRLSKAGDSVFPKKKELVDALSYMFEEDVTQYVDSFSTECSPCFSLKEEIKGLQSLAKELGLSSGVFHKTRQALSGCWEKVKEKESALREDRKARREKSIERLGKLSPKIDDLKKGLEGGMLSLEVAERTVAAILDEAKALDLERDEIKSLHLELQSVIRPLEERVAAERKERAAREARQRQENAEKRREHFKQVEALREEAESLPLDPLVEKWDTLVKEGDRLQLEGIEAELCASRLSAASDIAASKKWQALLEGEAEELAGEIHEFLDHRLKEKRKIKQTLEALRKTRGGSSLSFEESIYSGELLQEEKARLEALEEMIEEIEERLFETEM